MWEGNMKLILVEKYTHKLDFSQVAVLISKGHCLAAIFLRVLDNFILYFLETFGAYCKTFPGNGGN